MKILLIAGLAESLINFRGPLILALRARGVCVHVAAPGLPPGCPTRLQLQAMGVLVHEVPMARTGTNPLADLRTTWALLRLMRRIQPEKVLSYTIKPVIYGTLAAWLARVPQRFALITGLGYTFQGEGQRSKLQALVQCLYKLALARANLVFFQNPDDLALFRQRGLLQPVSKVCVVNGSGVDLNRFEYCPLSDISAGANFPSFLCIGRLLGDKGIREYAQAAKIVRQHHPSVRFVLVGSLDSNPNSISQAELDAWVAEGCIEYVGMLADVRPAIEACGVYVLPSYREGTPRTVLEAMATGRAVITTDAPGCRETVVNGYNGLLVPVKSVDELVEAMEQFIRNPALAHEMGQRGRKLAEDKYDVHKINAVMLQEMEIA
jgi:glycosyltransferase involved in cell wall biosynthesis